MTTFAHGDTGTPPSAWPIDDLPAAAWPGPGAHLLVLSAHPDDETLGAGGLIAGCARRGVRVTVVVATDGRNSHPGSPTTTPESLGATRRLEMAQALAVLAPGAGLHFLELPDGRLAGVGDELESAIRDRVDGSPRPVSHVVTPIEGDGHPDHERCAAAGARLAADLGAAHWSYPIWLWHWGDPASGALQRPGVHALALDPREHAAKGAALGAHRSQHAPLSDLPGDEPVLPPQVLAHFTRPREVFLVHPRASAGRPAYFEDLYAASDDPWGLGGRFYERRKRDLLLAALPRERFSRAFEPGCAGGLLSTALAARCDQVLCSDVSVAAVAQARARVPASVEVSRGRIPYDWPAGPFDLVVLSEVGYYCPSLPVLVDRIDASLTADGVVVACHWRHPAPDHPHTTDEVHDALAGRLARLVTHRERDLALDVFARDDRSVAQREGIV